MGAELQLDSAQTGGDVRPRPVWARALFTLGLIAGAALFAYQLWRSYLGVRENDAQLQQPAYLAAALACVAVMYALQMLAWRLTLGSLGYTLGLRATLQGFMISFMPRYVPGSVWGYLTRGEWLAHDHGIAHRVSWFGSVIEAALLCVTALGAAGVYRVGSRVGTAPALLVGLCAPALMGLAVALAMRIIGLLRAELRVDGPFWGGAVALGRGVFRVRGDVAVLRRVNMVRGTRVLPDRRVAVGAVRLRLCDGVAGGFLVHHRAGGAGGARVNTGDLADGDRGDRSLAGRVDRGRLAVCADPGGADLVGGGDGLARGRVAQGAKRLGSRRLTRMGYCYSAPCTRTMGSTYSLRVYLIKGGAVCHVHARSMSCCWLWRW